MEPRVFEDLTIPENIVLTSSDRMASGLMNIAVPTSEWSAPVEDLTDWRDEGPIFTYEKDGKWDVMFAPTLWR